MGDQAARSADAPSRHLRAVRGPVPALRKTVSLYFHDTEREERHRWTLQHLLAMVQRHRPEHVEDPTPDTGRAKLVDVVSRLSREDRALLAELSAKMIAIQESS